MTKKPFSDIEDIIRDAANANEPAFEGASWEKMEALLDKDKKKRPFVFWVLLIIGLFTAGALVWKWPTFEKRKPAGQIAEPITHPQNKAGTNATGMNTGVLVEKRTSAPIAPQIEEAIPIPTQAKNRTYPKIKSNKFKLTDLAASNPRVKNNRKTKSINKSKTGKIENAEKSGKDIHPSVAVEDLISKDESLNSTNVDSADNIESVKNDAVQLISKDIMDSSITSKKNNKSKATPRIFITAILGIEGSGTKLFTGGGSTARWGFGAGYQISNHFSIQAALYKSVKKYTAAGSAYKTKPGTYWNSVDIKTVNANCIVYEVPVLLQYDFSPAKKLHLFASGGLSSYIMKKEDYKYYYMRNGNPYYGAATYSGNQHLFSVVKFAAGISYQLNTNITFTANPAVSIPLSGVGEGQIDLYSTEFNVGIKYFPWSGK